MCKRLQFEPLEAACVDYLHRQLDSIPNSLLLSVLRLADYLGQGSLCEAAANKIVELPWHENMQRTKAFLRMPFFRDNIDRIDKVLHHTARGACCELQLFAVLHSMELQDYSIARLVKVELMSQAELNVLLDILTSGQHAVKTEGVLLLYKAMISRFRLMVGEKKKKKNQNSWATTLLTEETGTLDRDWSIPGTQLCLFTQKGKRYFK